MGNGHGETTMKTYKKFTIVVLLMIIIMIALFSFWEPTFLLNQRNCRQQLRSLWCIIMFYQDDNGKRWPPDIYCLTNYTEARLLFCPGVGTNFNFNKRTDYFYIDWSKLPHKNDPDFAKYPLMYDRNISNHNNRGINILMVDGTVKWDSNAKWLKKFASEHQDLCLPLPEANQ